MPIDYNDYPDDWKTVIRPAILERAKSCCEQCGVHDKMWVWYHPSLHYIFSQDVEDAIRWYGADEYTLHMHSEETPANGYTVCLTISHTNHDITDNDYDNLLALCQTCHLRHDTKYHTMNKIREKNKRLEEAGQMRMFF